VKKEKEEKNGIPANYLGWIVGTHARIGRFVVWIYRLSFICMEICRRA